jgi:ABC-type molybdate transport system ATPase subunit
MKHDHYGLLLNVNELVWDSNYGVMKGKIVGLAVILTAPKDIGDSMQVKVESKDVIISSTSLNASSLQNKLTVTIEKIESISQSSVLLTMSWRGSVWYLKTGIEGYRLLQFFRG